MTKPYRLPRVEAPRGIVHILTSGTSSRTLCGKDWYPPDWRLVDQAETCRRCEAYVKVRSRRGVAAE